MADAPRIREMLAAELELIERMPILPDLHYLGPRDLVLREARAYDAAPYDADRWSFVGETKACYSNAYHLACLHRDSLTYVEGVALGILPVFHAWCVDSEGRVVDPTWTPENGVTVPVEEREYLGIPFRLHFVSVSIMRRGYYGLIDDWQNHWPLCKQPLDPEAVAA